jgi:hypothetical protein
LGEIPGGFLFFTKGEARMTREKKAAYESPEALKRVIETLKGKKFRLDCGHHVTFGHFLGNDITVYNGKRPTIICSQCGY